MQHHDVFHVFASNTEQRVLCRRRARTTNVCELWSLPFLLVISTRLDKQQQTQKRPSLPVLYRRRLYMRQGLNCRSLRRFDLLVLLAVQQYRVSAFLMLMWSTVAICHKAARSAWVVNMHFVRCGFVFQCFCASPFFFWIGSCAILAANAQQKCGAFQVFCLALCFSSKQNLRMIFIWSLVGRPRYVHDLSFVCLF